MANFIDEQPGGAGGARVGSAVCSTREAAGGYLAGELAKNVTYEKGPKQRGVTPIVEQIKESLPYDIIIECNSPSPRYYYETSSILEPKFLEPHALISNFKDWFCNLKSLIRVNPEGSLDNLFYLFNSIRSELGSFFDYAKESFSVDYTTFLLLLDFISNFLLIGLILIILLSFFMFFLVLHLFFIRFKRDKQFSGAKPGFREALRPNGRRGDETNPTCFKVVEFFKSFKLYNVFVIFVFMLFTNISLGIIFFVIKFIIKIAITLLSGYQS